MKWEDTKGQKVTAIPISRSRSKPMTSDKRQRKELAPLFFFFCYQSAQIEGKRRCEWVRAIEEGRGKGKGEEIKEGCTKKKQVYDSRKMWLLVFEAFFFKEL